MARMSGETAKDILGVLCLLAVAGFCTVCLLFPRGIQYTMLVLRARRTAAKSDWISRFIGSRGYLWNVRIVGAIGVLACLFVCFMIAKNILR